MRVALTTTDIDLTGGVERVVVECANRIADYGHEVTVLAARVDRSVLAPAVRVLRLPVRFDLDARAGLGFRARATRALARLGPDVHGAFSVLSPLGGVFWAPSVHRVGYDLLRSRRSAVGRFALALHPYHRVRLRLERTMLAPGGYSALLAQAEGVKADIVGAYDVPPADIRVLPLGYDEAAFTPAVRHRGRAAARERLGFGSDDRVLLFVANELERKGWDTLMTAVERLGEPSLRVLGAGKVTPGDPPPWVTWVGLADDVAELHAAADAFVLPTRYEPWGLVIVEALGSGLPTVTTRLAGAAVALRDRETGFLLDDAEDAGELAEGIRWALSDAPAGPEATSGSVRDFAWSGIARRYLDLLEAAR